MMLYDSSICLICSFTWSHKAQVLLKGESQVAPEERHGELSEKKEREEETERERDLPFATPVE